MKVQVVVIANRPLIESFPENTTRYTYFDGLKLRTEK
jgi:hypothetical protein